MSLYPEFDSLSEENLRSLLEGDPEDPEDRECARVYFGELSRLIAATVDGRRFLGELARKSNGDRLAGIIDGLSLFGESRGLCPLLAQTIYSPDGIVVVATLDAARHLRCILPSDAVHPLIDSPTSEFVLAAVHRYLANSDPEGTIPKLISALSHPGPIVRQNAIDELAELDYKAAIPLIRQMVDDPDEYVRQAAQSALADFCE